jgi:transposase
MARPLILPEGFDKHDFLSLMKKESHGRNRMRLLAMHHLQLGKSIKAVSELVQSHCATVQSWLQRFREFSFAGLFESQRCGAPRKLQADQEAFLSNKIKALSEDKTNGYITGKELHQMLIDRYNIRCSLMTVYNSLHRLGFSWITSRSMHPKSSIKEQDAYKKTLPTL